jgi:carbonic anhydrase
MSAIDDFLQHSRDYAAEFPGPLPAPPARQVAVVTCMDARIDVYRVLGLRPGEAHVIRNGGGLVTPDVLRSLVISQRKLGTREIALIHHSECGLIGFDDDEFKAGIRAETGVEPPWESGSISDLDADVCRAVADVRTNPMLPHRDAVRGFVYDVAKGVLREVESVEAVR